MYHTNDTDIFPAKNDSTELTLRWDFYTIYPSILHISFARFKDFYGEIKILHLLQLGHSFEMFHMKMRIYAMFYPVVPKYQVFSKQVNKSDHPFLHPRCWP